MISNQESEQWVCQFCEGEEREFENEMIRRQMDRITAIFAEIIILSHRIIDIIEQHLRGIAAQDVEEFAF